MLDKYNPGWAQGSQLLGKTEPVNYGSGVSSPLDWQPLRGGETPAPFPGQPPHDRGRETWESCLDEIRALTRSAEIRLPDTDDVKVSVRVKYSRPSWGLACTPSVLPH